MKTPVSVLQELLARRGTVPKYELVQIEGMIHEPTFRYRVTVADLVGEFMSYRLYRCLALKIKAQNCIEQAYLQIWTRCSRLDGAVG